MTELVPDGLPSEVDLSILDLDVLLSEVASRFRTVICAGIEEKGDRLERVWFAAGSTVESDGLARFVSDRIREGRANGTEQDPGAV